MQAPKDKNDKRIIGQGSSKMVWELDEFAVINAYDRQRFHGLDGIEEVKQIEISNRAIAMEYNFTLYLNRIFPELIPRVYLFKDPYPFEDKRFRYVKDLCTRVKNNEYVFDKLIKVSDTLLDKGWVYLDIKPANLSENGQLSIMDTDYKSLYKVPEDMIPDFRKWVYMIVLIYTYNHLNVDPKTLIEFIKKKGIDSKMLRELRPKFSIEPWKKISKEIIEYGNNLFRDENVDDYIQLTYIMDPYAFFEAYGAKNNETTSVRFLKLMNLAKAEETVEVTAMPQEKMTRPMIVASKGFKDIPVAKAEPTREPRPRPSPSATPKRAGANPTPRGIARARAKPEDKKDEKPVAKAVPTPRRAKAAPKPQDKEVLQINPIAEPKILNAENEPNEKSYKQEDSYEVVPNVEENKTLMPRMSSLFGVTQKNKVGNKTTQKNGKQNPRRDPKRMVS